MPDFRKKLLERTFGKRQLSRFVFVTIYGIKEVLQNGTVEHNKARSIFNLAQKHCNFLRHQTFS